MNRKSITLARLRAAAAGGLLSLALAAPALADRGDWRRGDDSPRRGYPVYEHGRHCDRDWDRAGHGKRRQRDVYACRPCGRRWGDRAAFYRHLQSHHHVPLWAAPRAVVALDRGWSFPG
jgi:hypothetical protein